MGGEGAVLSRVSGIINRFTTSALQGQGHSENAERVPLSPICFVDKMHILHVFFLPARVTMDAHSSFDKSNHSI